MHKRHGKLSYYKVVFDSMYSHFACLLNSARDKNNIFVKIVRIYSYSSTIAYFFHLLRKSTISYQSFASVGGIYTHNAKKNGHVPVFAEHTVFTE